MHLSICKDKMNSFLKKRMGLDSSLLDIIEKQRESDAEFSTNTSLGEKNWAYSHQIGAAAYALLPRKLTDNEVCTLAPDAVPGRICIDDACDQSSTNYKKLVCCHWFCEKCLDKNNNSNEQENELYRRGVLLGLKPDTNCKVCTKLLSDRVESIVS
eukprot:Pgem_evm1s8434